jgi:hypothetical protein
MFGTEVLEAMAVLQDLGVYHITMLCGGAMVDVGVVMGAITHFVWMFSCLNV